METQKSRDLNTNTCSYIFSTGLYGRIWKHLENVVYKPSYGGTFHQNGQVFLSFFTTAIPLPHSEIISHLLPFYSKPTLHQSPELHSFYSTFIHVGFRSFNLFFHAHLCTFYSYLISLNYYKSPLLTLFYR